MTETNRTPKTRRPGARGSRLAGLLLASTVLAGGAARAQDLPQGAPVTAPTTPSQRGAQSPGDSVALQEIVVTAQKREENLQRVPISIQALGTATLEQRQVNNFQDFVKYLPSVSYQSVAPSVTNVYIRGVASGGDGNHSGPQPSVGMYLDEQPITTIQGALDIHIYDIARVETLSGPQGTLYGANSESGTIRLITNKPNPRRFEAGYDLEGNTLRGDFGGVAEGFVNQPITDKIAIRLVGFAEHDAGYIDNVLSNRVFPSHTKDDGTVVPGTVVDNRALVKDNYNDVDTFGGRAALRIDLTENWTATASLIGQDQRTRGVFGYDSTIGDLKVAHVFPEAAHDRWAQAALTIEGKFHDFDIVYSGGYFRRNVDSQSDYSDYSFFYDKLDNYGQYTTDASGNFVDSSQRIVGKDQFTKESHEFRIASPKDWRFRFVGGLFYERQSHNILQDYRIAGLDPSLSISNHPGTVWLTDQVRTDRDAAAFGEFSYDLTPKLTVNGGVRVFESRNSLRGFYGFGANFSSSQGEAKCFLPIVPYRTAPCLEVDKQVTEVSQTYKGNLTYKIDANKLVYFTASSGYRPGGLNRRGSLPPYLSDFLYNYEIGWKTSFFENRVRWNVAAFWEQWDNFQFSFLAQNGLTQIANAGSAEIKGLETDVAWRPMRGLDITGAATYVNAELTLPFCNALNPDGTPITNCAAPAAPKGQTLPVTPNFKTNLVVRYSWPVGAWQAHVQGAGIYQSSSWADLRTYERSLLGRQKAYGSFDFAAGAERNKLTVELFVKNLFDRRGQVYRSTECAAGTCAFTGEALDGTTVQGEVYVVPIQPRTFGIRIGQKF